jgi:hypothetical protein
MIALAAAGALAAVGAVRVFADSGEEQRATAATGRSVLTAMPRLPASPEPAFTPRRPALLHESATARWAPVVREVVARRAPRADAAPVGDLTALTPEGTNNVALVLGSAVSDGTVWAKVPLPMLPNGTVGWVPRSALGGYVFVHTRLVIDRQRLTATLLRDGRVVFRAPIGIGEPRWPTPGGSFYVRVRMTSFRSRMYGPVAFGTNARSRVLTDWPGGGFVGIHGTDTPEILPGRVSHGCIRLRNEDILRLDHLMPVGTPVRIV